MTRELYLSCFFACLIGNIIHILFKARSTSIDYSKVGKELSFWEFLKVEKWVLLADAASSLGLVYLADEWIDSPYVMGKIKTVFVFIGFTGSYIIMFFASASKKNLRQIVDAIPK